MYRRHYSYITTPESERGPYRRMAYQTPTNYFRGNGPTFPDPATNSNNQGMAPKCLCGQPAITRVIGAVSAKTGQPNANAGKSFWCCQKGDRNGGCKMPFKLATELQLQYQQPPPQRPTYDQPIVDLPYQRAQYQQQPSSPPTPTRMSDQDSRREYEQQAIKKRKIEQEEEQENHMDSFKLSLQLLRDRIELLENKTNDLNHIKCDIRSIKDGVSLISQHLKVMPTYNSDEETDDEPDKLNSKQSVAPKQIPIK